MQIGSGVASYFFAPDWNTGFYEARAMARTIISLCGQFFGDKQLLLNMW